jgi:hypothetical protein
MRNLCDLPNPLIVNCLGECRLIGEEEMRIVISKQVMMFHQKGGEFPGQSCLLFAKRRLVLGGSFFGKVDQGRPKMGRMVMKSRLIFPPARRVNLMSTSTPWNNGAGPAETVAGFTEIQPQFRVTQRIPRGHCDEFEPKLRQCSNPLRHHGPDCRQFPLHPGRLSRTLLSVNSPKDEPIVQFVGIGYPSFSGRNVTEKFWQF